MKDKNSYTIEVYLGDNESPTECVQSCPHCPYKNKGFTEPMRFSDIVLETYSRLEEALLESGENIRRVAIGGNMNRSFEGLSLSVSHKVQEILVAVQNGLSIGSFEGYKNIINNSLKAFSINSGKQRPNFLIGHSETDLEPILNLDKLLRSLFFFFKAYDSSVSDILESGMYPVREMSLSYNHLTKTDMEIIKDNKHFFEKVFFQILEEISKESSMDGKATFWNEQSDIINSQYDIYNSHRPNEPGACLSTRYILKRSEADRFLLEHEKAQINTSSLLLMHDGINVGHDTYFIGDKNRWIDYQTLNQILSRYKNSSKPLSEHLRDALFV